MSEFDDYYNRINCWKDPYSKPAVCEDTKRFWLNSADEGIWYLVERLADERHIELMEGVANILADIGPESVSAIVHVLNHRPLWDDSNAAWLLKALGWIGEHESHGNYFELLDTIDGHLNSDDDDIFEAAVLACKCLPVEKARLLLSYHMPRIEKIEHYEDYLSEVFDRPPCSNHEN